MKEEKRIWKVMNRLRKEYPDADGTSLNYENPVQLLVATILSAQSTDETVNKITENLFDRYQEAEDFAKADREELEKSIYSSGFYRNKAKWIIECCRKLVEDYDSKIPEDIEELTQLKGVGRKTANVVLSEVFGVRQGVAVDTHVMRLTKRLGFTEEERREKIEQDIMELLPTSKWYEYTNLLIAHGRKVCEAKNPKCGACVVSDFCPSAFTFD